MRIVMFVELGRGPSVSPSMISYRRSILVETIDLSAPGVIANPYPTYARLRRSSPVAIAPRPFFGRAYVLSRHADVHRALHDPQLVNDRSNVPGTRDLAGSAWTPSVVRMLLSNLITRDGDDHRRLRALTLKAFTQHSIERLGPTIEATLASILDRAAIHGGLDVVEQLALPVPLRTISLLLGVPEHERGEFDRWATRLLEDGVATTAGSLAVLPGIAKMRAFLDRLVEHKRERPGDDLISSLVAAEAEGDRLTQLELVGTVFLLLIAGHESTANYLSSCVLALLDHPEQFAWLREQPRIPDRAVDELLRYTSPVSQGAPRFARQDLELHGQTIPQGAMVITLLGSANHDEAVFAAPEQLDLTRETKRQLGFGFGVHYCLGAQLARLEAKLFLQALVEYPNLRLTIPRESLRWRRSVLLRGLTSLPIMLGRRRPNP